MLTESALRLELHRRGQVEVLDVQTDRALIGSGAHCDVRLAPDEAAVEQLVVEARDDAVFAQVRSFDPPCLLNGAPFVDAKLSPDALVEMSNVGLRVRLVAVTETQRAQAKTGTSRSPALQALCLIGLAAGFYFVLHPRSGSESAFSSAATPPLLFQGAKSACPQQDANAARSLAEELARDAANKSERAPFYPGDGVLAVPLYERAAACYDTAREVELARDARAEAALLKRRTREELHLRHLRIERLIVQEKYDQLRREALLALELVPDKAHPYAAWLSALARETEVRALSARSK